MGGGTVAAAGVPGLTAVASAEDCEEPDNLPEDIPELDDSYAGGATATDSGTYDWDCPSRRGPPREYDYNIAATAGITAPYCRQDCPDSSSSTCYRVDVTALMEAWYESSGDKYGEIEAFKFKITDQSDSINHIQIQDNDSGNVQASKTDPDECESISAYEEDADRKAGAGASILLSVGGFAAGHAFGAPVAAPVVVGSIALAAYDGDKSTSDNGIQWGEATAGRSGESYKSVVFKSHSMRLEVDSEADDAWFDLLFYIEFSKCEPEGNGNGVGAITRVDNFHEPTDSC
ncbi:hypothetical protein BRC99_04580 [Halobacteriales archaeon QS_7_69_60]|nr:MAG: hypothetical protein BRC99_04580 [Halobacteriales archaeon QS_7_69_60]